MPSKYSLELADSFILYNNNLIHGKYGPIPKVYRVSTSCWL